MARVGRVFSLITDYLGLAIGKACVNKACKCNQCKTMMNDEFVRLYLLPCRFDEQHEECAEYYLNNAYPINHVSEIPTGQRACRITVMVCPKCGFRKVNVTDFLKVRDQELLKSGDMYDLETFQGFLGYGYPCY